MISLTSKTIGANTLIISKDNLPVDILSRAFKTKDTQKDLGEIVILFQQYLEDLFKKLLLEENIESKLWELLSKLQTIDKDFLTEITGSEDLASEFLEQIKAKNQNIKEGLNELNLDSKDGFDGLYIDYDNYVYEFNR